MRSSRCKDAACGTSQSGRRSRHPRPRSSIAPPRKLVVPTLGVALKQPPIAEICRKFGDHIGAFSEAIAYDHARSGAWQGTSAGVPDIN
jgi:hypothetical protein